MNFFLWIDEAQVGPYPWEQIKALLAEKSVTPETLFWKEGMTDWLPLSTLLGPESTAVIPPEEEARIFCGFWRRAGALVIDWIILCIAGNILGVVFFDFLSRLGSLGPLLGMGIGLLYFGLQNSALCGGQTLGKRLLGIQVVDAEGKLISPSQSLVRYVVLYLPFFILNPAILGSIATTWTGLLLETALSLWFATIIYLFLFNVPSRQSLHDCIVQTYVVRTGTRGAVKPTPFWTWHYVLLCLIGFCLLGMAGGAVLLLQWAPIADQLSVVQAVQADPRVEYASSMAGTNWTFTEAGTKKTTSLEINAFWNGKPDNMDEAVRSIAAAALAKAPDEVAQQDVLKIAISHGYDLGFASGAASETFEHSPQEWRRIVADASPP
jgi:uncharacterized RDD family membrane protein YckC